MQLSCFIGHQREDRIGKEDGRPRVALCNALMPRRNYALDGSSTRQNLRLLVKYALKRKCIWILLPNNTAP